jgi:hypothetical protein
VGQFKFRVYHCQVTSGTARQKERVHGTRGQGGRKPCRASLRARSRERPAPAPTKTPGSPGVFFCAQLRQTSCVPEVTCTRTRRFSTFSHRIHPTSCTCTGGKVASRCRTACCQLVLRVRRASWTPVDQIPISNRRLYAKDSQVCRIIVDYLDCPYRFRHGSGGGRCHGRGTRWRVGWKFRRRRRA